MHRLLRFNSIKVQLELPAPGEGTAASGVSIP